VRRTRWWGSKRRRGEGAVGDEGRAAEEDYEHDQPGAAAANEPALG
jgi:hypothetical protein